MFNCPNCGGAVEDGRVFCPNCGTKLSDIAQPPVGTAAPNAAPQPDYGTQPNYGAQPGYNAPGYGAQPGYGAPGYGAQPGYGAPGYGAPGYPQRGPTGGAGGPVSFPQRNLATCIILSIVTCGIYGIVWFINMVNDLNEASGDPNAKSGGTVFLLSLVTCGIYMLIWFYKAGEQINAAKGSRGMPVDSNSGVMYLLLAFFGLSIVSEAMIQSELNKIAAMYGAPAA